jgi:hypothetical protein
MEGDQTLKDYSVQELKLKLCESELNDLGLDASML